MLNGKFFTGLPPKMIDRNGTPTRNRQESHLFWPDDTKAESVVETRLKRRNSFQVEPSPKERLQEQMSQNGGGGGGDLIDTKGRFHKEFTKSSIQFYDNIPAGDNAQQRKAPMLRGGRPTKKEVTMKPNATILELPNDIDDEYAANKKKQTFSSKIHFNDYVDENWNKRNNVRAPKMDMNDKRELERNTKNSPKLQVKKNVRSLSVERKKQNNNNKNNINNAPSSETQNQNNENGNDAKPTATIENNDDERMNTRSEKVIKNSVKDERINGDDIDNDHHDNRTMTSPRVYRDNNRRRLDYSIYEEDDLPPPAPRYGRNRARWDERHYDHDDDGDVYSRERAVREQQLPKKILKTRRDYRDYNDYPDDVYRNDVDYIERNIRNVRVKSSPTRKHVTYRDELYADEMPDVYYNDHRSNDIRSSRITNRPRSNATRNSRAQSPNIRKTGSNQRQQQYRSSTPDYAADINIESYEYKENGNCAATTSTTNKSLNNFNNNNNKNNNNSNSNKNNIHNHNNQLNNQQPRATPKMSTAASASADETLESAADAQKHLRSSLCFSDGEIVADNGASTKTPTSSQRRNARTLSANQRISVGLPQ